MPSLNKYSILDNLIEGVQIIGPDFQYLYVNKAVTQQAKLSQEQLLGFTMMEKYPGIENTPVFQSIQNCMTSRQSINLINEFRFPDDSIGYFELRMQRINDGVLIFSYDVTDQKKAEAVIQRSNIELEELVRERTRELAEKNKVIQQQITHLETLNDTKNKFFGIMAHDLKSPINSLKSFSGILIESIENFDKDKMLKVSKDIQTRMDNTLKLADNLIEWAKLQMNLIEHSPTVVTVEAVVSKVIELLGPLAQRKEINLTKSIQEALSISVDSNHFEFILRNLIGNSIKFTLPKGQVLVTANQLGQKEAKIEVIDNGVGIHFGKLNKLFSIAGNKSTKGTLGEKGTGLGLMLCHEFVKLNNGKIEVTSKEGEGSTFSLIFQRL